MLSDRLAEAAEGFGVMGSYNGLPHAQRTTFLVADETVVASWKHGADDPPIDAAIAVSRRND